MHGAAVRHLFDLREPAELTRGFGVRAAVARLHDRARRDRAGAAGAAGALFMLAPALNISRWLIGLCARLPGRGAGRAHLHPALAARPDFRSAVGVHHRRRPGGLLDPAVPASRRHQLLAAVRLAGADGFGAGFGAAGAGHRGRRDAAAAGRRLAACRWQAPADTRGALSAGRPDRQRLLRAGRSWPTSWPRGWRARKRRRARSQRAARMQAQVNELVIETLADGVLVVDAQGGCTRPTRRRACCWASAAGAMRAASSWRRSPHGSRWWSWRSDLRAARSAQLGEVALEEAAPARAACRCAPA